MDKRYSAVLSAEEIRDFVPDPCLTCGSPEVVVQWLELAPGSRRYVHGLEVCRACARAAEHAQQPRFDPTA